MCVGLECVVAENSAATATPSRKPLVKTSLLSAFALSLCLGSCAMHGRVGSPSTPEDRPLVSVAALDVSRYMGGWYEIAKLPNWFQRNCARDTRAVYRLLPDGQVEVDNSCRNKQGEMERAIGAARLARAGKASELEVRFAPEWLSFVPLVWANYWVIDIDPQYQLVAVSEPGRKYLWVLSRRPQVDERAYEALLVRLREKGFDLAELARTPQSN